MKTVPIQIKGGVLQIPENVKLPPEARLAVILLDEKEPSLETHVLGDTGGAFDFLREEPDIYSDADVLLDRRNPRFVKRS